MTATRGRLPARIYWFRRSLVLVVALALVFGIARVLGHFGGDDASASSGDAASRTAQTGLSQPDHLDGPTLTPAAGQQGTAPLSQPTGTCDDSDVAVTPYVDDFPGGGGEPLTMKVTSTSGETCTWHVSARSIAVRIVRGGDRIWSSQDCPGVVPDTTVVVRPPDEKKTRVDIAWGGHESVPSCVGGQPYVGLGSYDIQAASIGGKPSRASFRIVAPPRPRVTKTAKATATPSNGPSKKPSQTASVQPSKSAKPQT